MKNKRCRVCGSEFFKKPLLEYKNMPAAAQYLPDQKFLYCERGINLVVCECAGCGLVQLANEPVSYYREVIRAAGISAEMKNFRRKQFKNLVLRYSLKGKKIIEIGCGGGEYLSIMSETGVKAYGLEFSGKSVKQCIQNGLKVSCGFVAKPVQKLKSAPFEAFFILNFLEHLPDPNSVLKGIAYNLTDDAVGLVEVPNFDLMLKKNLFSEFISDHLFYFSRATLISTLNQNGFEVLECSVAWHGYIISAVVQKKKKLDLSRFSRSRLQLKKEIVAYLQRFKNKEVAIWGAGHQALAVMAQTGLAGKIKYVVDSAPIKQGRYTPATHIPIVSPGRLKSDPAEAIIVMAAGYSDEVVRIIRKNFGRGIKICVLRDYRLAKK